MRVRTRKRVIALALLATMTIASLTGCQELTQELSAGRATESLRAEDGDPARVQAQATSPSGSPSPTPRPAPLPPPAGASSDLESGSIVRAVEAVRPAVVNITTQMIAYDFYLRPIPEESGTGSGVIFDDNGYILTNSHVVQNAQGLKVTLPDGRTYDGRIVGADPRTDLAVVKIEDANLPVASLGESDALQIGETVIAIGHALGLPGGPTVTSGIVGALGRTIRESNGVVLYDLIQTDAAINPGNSGGPLINLRGQVVGINTAIAADAPGGGIGFAIAINSAQPIAEQLIAQGRVVRPWVGVTLQNVTPGLAARYNLPVNKGALVYAIQRGSPGALAGIRRGDIIVQFAGEEVQDDVSFLKAINMHSIGETVQIVLVRDSERITVNVTLEELPANAQ